MPTYTLEGDPVTKQNLVEYVVVELQGDFKPTQFHSDGSVSGDIDIQHVKLSPLDNELNGDSSQAFWLNGDELGNPFAFMKAFSKFGKGVKLPKMPKAPKIKVKPLKMARVRLPKINTRGIGKTISNTTRAAGRAVSSTLRAAGEMAQDLLSQDDQMPDDQTQEDQTEDTGEDTTGYDETESATMHDDEAGTAQTEFDSSELGFLPMLAAALPVAQQILSPGGQGGNNNSSPLSMLSSLIPGGQGQGAMGIAQLAAKKAAQRKKAAQAKKEQSRQLALAAFNKMRQPIRQPQQIPQKQTQPQLKLGSAQPRTLVQTNPNTKQTGVRFLDNIFSPTIKPPNNNLPQNNNQVQAQEWYKNPMVIGAGVVVIGGTVYFLNQNKGRRR